MVRYFFKSERPQTKKKSVNHFHNVQLEKKRKQNKSKKKKFGTSPPGVDSRDVARKSNHFTIMAYAPDLGLILLLQGIHALKRVSVEKTV